MNSEDFRYTFELWGLASLCSYLESSKVSWIVGLGDYVTWFQYFTILLRINETIEVLLVSLCTAQFDVL